MINKRYDNFIKWNDEMIKKFDLEHYHKNLNFVIRVIEQGRVKSILKFLEADKQDRIIEIGCGAGDILGKINQGNLTGVDISDYILDIARKRYKDITFIFGNAEKLPEEVTCFKYDKIICSEVLEHIENPDRVLDEIKKIAKKDSTIVVSIPNEKLINKVKTVLRKLKLFNLFFSNISKKMDDEWHLHSFDLSKLKEMTKRDYVIKKIRKIPFCILPLRYVVKLGLKND